MKTKEEIVAALELTGLIDHEVNGSEHDYYLECECNFCATRRALLWVLGASDPETGSSVTTPYPIPEEWRFVISMIKREAARRSEAI
jgi:hypothetical protein